MDEARKEMERREEALLTAKEILDDVIENLELEDEEDFILNQVRAYD